MLDDSSSGEELDVRLDKHLVNTIPSADKSSSSSALETNKYMAEVGKKFFYPARITD